jgi:beta-glucosidase/6-phospho-beta-glucosidase/beta-galactosidase
MCDAESVCSSRPEVWPEVWGGFECTVLRTRVGWRDQLRETGHYTRIGDLDAAAALGVRAIRQSVLLEHVAPDRPDECNWSWHDERLAYLRRLRIAPIAGLIHHGGGPRYTHLLDPNFPELVAAHAERTARRYPWIEAWTPINEPLTTARFSGLYGYWFPYRKDLASCLRMVANQCRAVLLSMRAVRKVHPNARLVQTEDLGRIFSTPPLDYQAVHENERRWLSLDLLTGRLTRDHGWWQRFLDAGVPEKHLMDFLTGDMAPMVIGLNYYITSERFLDHRADLYPDHFKGGNGLHRYADIEAVRVPLSSDQKTGWEARLLEAWSRYKTIPIALTETHIGWCTEEEQVRWLTQAWLTVIDLRRRGVDLQAITIWALCGAVDWDSLLTRRDGHYEPGAFDVQGSNGAPRPTLTAQAVASLARHGNFTHPALQKPGWWERGDRFLPQLLMEAAE